MTSGRPMDESPRRMSSDGARQVRERLHNPPFPLPYLLSDSRTPALPRVDLLSNQRPVVWVTPPARGTSERRAGFPLRQTCVPAGRSLGFDQWPTFAVGPSAFGSYCTMRRSSTRCVRTPLQSSTRSGHSGEPPASTPPGGTVTPALVVVEPVAERRRRRWTRADYGLGLAVSPWIFGVFEPLPCQLGCISS